LILAVALFVATPLFLLENRSIDAVTPPEPLAPDANDQRPNILLFSIDTLRADHLGAYGYERPTSPRLDRLARRSVRFTDAWAPTPWTLPSHAALLTGLHPRNLGITDRRSALPQSARLLAEALSDSGYRTAAFVDSMPGGFVGRSRGFARGFDEYRHLPAEAGSHYRYDMAVTAEQASQWLRRNGSERPFFLFLHTKSVHALPSSAPSPDPHRPPYDKPEPYRSRFLSADEAVLSWADADLGSGVQFLRNLNERLASGDIQGAEVPEERIRALKSLYDGGILYVDDHFGRILDTLEETGLDGDTVIIVTSDHGEAFLEHNLMLHKELYRELLRVPLIVHLPWEGKPRTVSTGVTLMDVAPTILRLAGVERAGDVQGRPLPLDEGEESAAQRTLFSYYHSRPNYYYEAYAIRDSGFTLVHHRLGRESDYRNELYEHASDPDERSPIEDRPARRAEMLQRLRGWMEQENTGAPRIEVDAETLDHLRALGYAE
jgi:arylsulfatase A-like enzyme